MADETKCVELSDAAYARIGEAVARAMPRRQKHNWVAICSLALGVIIFLSGGIGVWVASSTKSTALDIRLTAAETTIVKNGGRIDVLEHANSATGNATQQLVDLKDAFTEFRGQYKEDTRDIKQQVQDLQSRIHNH